MYGQFNPFINSSSGGGGGTSEKVRYSIIKFSDKVTGEITYKLGQSINDGIITYVGDIISYGGDQILVEYGGQPVILNAALAEIETFIDKTYNFTTFTELEIDTRGKTLQQITDELIALDLPQNTVVTGQLYADALPFVGNGEAEVIVNKPAYWWKCTSLTNAPYSWNAIVGSGGWSGIKMDWTPTYYNLPTATAQTLGGVKIGNNINIDQNGVISVDDPVEYQAGDGISFSESAEGIEINNDGVISIATGASDNTIDITTKDGTSSVSINLSKATDAVLGGVKVGTGLNIENDGTLNVDGYTAGEGISFSQGQNLDTVISNDGVLSVVEGEHNTIDVTTIEGITQIPLGTTYSEGVGIEIVNASSGLPSGYTRLEYVTCNFRQYINTLYYANQDTVVEIEAATQNKYSDMPLFGTRKSGSEQQFVCWFGGMYSTYEETGCLFVLGDYTWQSYNPILLGGPVGQPIRIVCTPNSLSVNDVVLWEGTEVYNIDTTNPIYLGACNQNGSPFQTYFDGDIYDCIIKENDTVIKHFIPCTSPTNVVGFYETQSETFIRSITGTDFIAGPPSPGQEGMIINNTGVLDINSNSSDNTILDVDFQDGVKHVQLPKYSAGTGISFIPPQSAGESTAINNSGVLDITAGSASNTVIVTKAGGDTTITIPTTAQVQANWTQADDTKIDYIKNKPNLGAAALKNVDQTPTTESQNLVESGGVYSALSNKVDKVNGKGLSTNDFTDALKNKLDEIDAGAEVNQNAYSNIKIDNTTITAGAKTDTLELIAGANVLLTPNVNDKSIEINSRDTTYSVAVPSVGGIGGVDGLLSAIDKEKLDNIDTEWVLSNTVEGWNSQLTLISKKDIIYVYTNYQLIDNKYVPGIKIGDGQAYLIDLPFICQNNVTQEEKDRWNNKVSVALSPSDNENLVFIIS